MNRKMAALTVVALLSSSLLYAFAADTKQQGSPLLPGAIPGINQAHGADSEEDKANKKGEEASGSNSGADSQTLKKEAESSNSSDEGDKQESNDSEG
ncbi:hypothetical protein IMF27_03975 [Pseudomonas sp. PCH199]|nr:hypothetical protein [Pseudomonas sp. PCH199]PAM84926.1 hypothetical protein CES87_04060 [Pseudomonas sp. ERMR1:02]